MSTNNVSAEEIRPLLEGSTTGSLNGRGSRGNPRDSHQSDQYSDNGMNRGGEVLHFTVYPWRWYILGVLALLNICNGMMWISFSPIADITAEFYHIDASKVNMLSIIFMITCIPLGFVSIWMLDVLGLRSAIVLSALVTFLGSGLRVVSCQHVIPVGMRYALLLSGQTLAAAAQPLVMFTPTKIAAVWFPANQRALANSVATVSNPLGIMVGNLLSPALVKQQSHIPFLMYMYSIGPVLAVFLAVFGVCNSEPPTPPTASAAAPHVPFLKGLKKLMVCDSYWILTLSFGTSVALFTCLNTLVEQMLCPLGYSDTFAGWCGALMIAVGLIGAAGSAVYVDKTRHFEEVAKVGVCVATLALIGFLIACRYAHMEVVLIVLCGVIGFFGFASNPVCLELSAEYTYPIAEATSAGMLILSGQIQSLVMIFVMEMLSRSFDLNKIPHQTCHTTGVTGVVPQDFTVPNLVLCGFGTLSTILFTAAFKPKYLRLKAEMEVATQQIVHNSHCQGDDNQPIRISDSRSGRGQREEAESPAVAWAETVEPDHSVDTFGRSQDRFSDNVAGSGASYQNYQTYGKS